MPVYDGTLFEPPAPVARVTLRNPATGETASDVPMLIDSGADVTLVPQSWVGLLRVGVDTSTGYELMGLDGRTSIAPAVQLDLLFLRRTFRGRFLLSQQEWGILGRDVLNHVPLLLDGPHLTWSEQGSSKK